MSNRARTRRAARKARPSEAPSQVTDVAAPAPAADPVSELIRTAAPDAANSTDTAQLRALEAGWDELLA